MAFRQRTFGGHRGAIGADRVMLGSDFPWYDPVRTADLVAGLPGLGTEERAAILGGTAVRLLDLERPRAV